MEFVPRLTEPERDNSFWTTYNPYYQSGVGLPNCTCYAWGRIAELKQVTSYQDAVNRVKLSYRNARQWWDDNTAYASGDVPKLGSVAVFEGIATNAKGQHFGHVMVVEEINGDTITLSGSDADVDGSGGRYFYVDTLTLNEMKDANYHGGLIGFIYACPEYEKGDREPMSELDSKKLVVCDYAEYLGRMPSSGDIEADSKNIIDTCMTTEEYDKSFLVSQEYHDRCGSLAAQDFVTRCYRAFLGRFPESEDALMFHVNKIMSGEYRYRDIAWNIYQSPEAKAYRGEN